MSTLEFNDALIGIHGNLHSFAYNFTKNEDDAKDLTQETMMKALAYRNYYTPQSNFKAWVFTIMRNLFINSYRKKKKEKTFVDLSTELNQFTFNPNRLESSEIRLLNNELTKQISTLDEDYQKPFLMYVDGFKYKEIAEELKIPIGTVKSRIHAARQRLMVLLADYNKN